MLSKLKASELTHAKYFVLFLLFFGIFLFEFMTSDLTLYTYTTHSPNIAYSDQKILNYIKIGFRSTFK